MSETGEKVVFLNGQNDLIEGDEQPSREEGRPFQQDDLKRKTVSYIPIDRIRVSAFQPRKEFGERELDELARSIVSKGVIQPVVVRPLNAEAGQLFSYELVAGERRLRASKLANLKHVPAIIQDLSDRESLEVTIIENAQRQDLNPIDEAAAFKKLSEEFGIGQAEIARVVGKSRAAITNSIRLLQLDPTVLEMLRRGELTAGHGRALLVIDDAVQQLSLARKAIERPLSVRELEDEVERIIAGVSKRRESAAPDKAGEKIAERLIETLGVKAARVKSGPNGERKLSLHFETEASWKRFMARMR